MNLWVWLKGRSKAWAFDAYYEIDEYMPGCGGLGRQRHKFLVDGTGNEAEPAAKPRA
ncbi:MAG: hypothetical protein ABDI20_01225 [Candidatus Bipolaricaulaceae bacterium]